MKNKQIVIASVGIVIGFILGFFASQAFVEKNPVTEPAAASSELPEGHPPEEMIEKVRELETWVQSHPEDLEARIALGNLYYDMGRFDASIKWYEEVLRLEPSNVNVMTDLGTAYLYTGSPMKAVELYKQSLSIDPNHAQALQNLGVAYFYSGNFEEAVEKWETLLKTHPNYPHREELEKQIQKAKDHLEQDRS